jgi:6-phosphogluconolactonase (cycloisomerase 2 family)
MVLVLSFAAVLPVYAQSFASGSVGNVYVLTNDPAGNQVVAYDRSSDGSLTLLGKFNTGGLGSGVGLTVPPDPLGSQNALLLSPDGRWLFAVNAGSNEISSLQVTSDGLHPVDTVSSNGDYPVSLTLYNNYLFVLNAGGDGNISGFKVDSHGHLTPISGSTRSLNAATPAMGAQPNILEAPAQVGFSPDGKWLIVTDKGGVSGTGKIDLFRVNSKGLPSSNFETTTTAHPVPFGFIFDQFGHLLVVDAGASSVSAYSIQSDGDLTTLSAVVTGQAATCWIAASASGDIYTDNTGGNSISAIDSASNGQLEVLNGGGPAALTGAGTLPLDVGISIDGRFLYSLEVGVGKVGIFQIGSDGGLSPLGQAEGFAAGSGAQGIAVR